MPAKKTSKEKNNKKKTGADGSKKKPEAEVNFETGVQTLLITLAEAGVTPGPFFIAYEEMRTDDRELTTDRALFMNWLLEIVSPSVPLAIETEDAARTLLRRTKVVLDKIDGDVALLAAEELRKILGWALFIVKNFDEESEDDAEQKEWYNRNVDEACVNFGLDPSRLEDWTENWSFRAAVQVLLTKAETTPPLEVAGVIRGLEQSIDLTKPSTQWPVHIVQDKDQTSAVTMVVQAVKILPFSEIPKDAAPDHYAALAGGSLPGIPLFIVDAFHAFRKSGTPDVMEKHQVGIREARPNSVGFVGLNHSVQCIALLRKLLKANRRRLKASEEGPTIQGWRRSVILAVSLENKATAPTCANCGQPADPPKICSRCKSTVFCSPECMRTGWKSGGSDGRGHKPLCDRLVTLKKSSSSSQDETPAPSVRASSAPRSSSRMPTKKKEATASPEEVAKLADRMLELAMGGQRKSNELNALLAVRPETQTVPLTMVFVSMAAKEADPAERPHIRETLIRILSGGVRVTDRRQAFAEFDQVCRQHEMIERMPDQPYQLNPTSEDTLARWSSTARLEDLEPITITELETGQIHRGRVLKVTVARPVFKTVGINAIVEDDDGELVSMALYNMLNDVSGAKIADARRLVPCGATLHIKEPYYKLSNSGRLAVRCDVPTNVVIDEDDLLSNDDSEALKAIGNAHFKTRAYDRAVRAYDRGIKLSENASSELHVALLSNRAACHIPLKAYDLAVRDCRAILRVDPSHEKAKYRLAVALGSAGNYDAALGKLDDLLSTSPSCAKSAREQQTRFRAMRNTEVTESFLKDLGTKFAGARRDGAKHAMIIDDVGSLYDRVHLVKNGTKKNLVSSQQSNVNEIILFETPALFSGSVSTSMALDTSGKYKGAVNPSDGLADILAGALLKRATLSPLWRRRLAFLTDATLSVPTVHDDDTIPGDGIAVPTLDGVRDILRRNLITFGDKSQAEDQSHEDDRLMGGGVYGYGTFLQKSKSAKLVNARATFLGPILVVRATKFIPIQTPIVVRASDLHNTINTLHVETKRSRR